MVFASTGRSRRRHSKKRRTQTTIDVVRAEFTKDSETKDPPASNFDACDPLAPVDTRDENVCGFEEPDCTVAIAPRPSAADEQVAQISAQEEEEGDNVAPPAPTIDCLQQQQQRKRPHRASPSARISEDDDDDRSTNVSPSKRRRVVAHASDVKREEIDDADDRDSRSLAVAISPETTRYQRQQQSRPFVPDLDFFFDPDVYFRLNPLRRRPGTPIVPAGSKPLANMIGMREVSQLLCDVLAKPVVARELCESVLGRLTALHFCIVGPSGTGKCAALRLACSAWNIEMVTIRPHSCQMGDVAQAMYYAARRPPCVVCFEEFDNLLAAKPFCDEFMAQVAGNKDLCNRWNRVWLAFCVENPDVLTRTNVIGALCGQRIAYYQTPSPTELARLFYDEFLCGGGGVKVDPVPTEIQWSDLERAVEGRTPRDLMTFAGAVLYSVVSKNTVTALVQIARTKSVTLGDEDDEKGGGDQKRASLLPSSPNVEGIFDPITATSTRSLALVDSERPLSVVSRKRTATVGDTSSPRTASPMLRISWTNDVDTMYVSTPPDRDGIVRRVIPQCDMGFISL